MFIGKLALLKQLDKESSSHAEHPRVLSLWGLKLEQTRPTLLLNEADPLLWFVAGIRSQRVGATYHHTCTFICASYYELHVQVDDMRPASFMSEHMHSFQVDRKNRCRVCWTITGLTPPPSGHSRYYSCTRTGVLRIDVSFYTLMTLITFIHQYSISLLSYCLLNSLHICAKWWLCFKTRTHIYALNMNSSHV